MPGLPNERSNRIGRNGQFQHKRPERALHLLLEGGVAVCNYENAALIGVFSGNVIDIGQLSRRGENARTSLDHL